MAIIKGIVDALNGNSAIRSVKNVRSQIVDLSFRAGRRREAEAVINRLERTGSKNICFTVAFNVPWAIEIMIAAWRRFPTNLDLVVANNSSDREKRSKIRDLCQLYDVPHLDLPYNPEWNPCRSHGIAMNWVYYNVIRHLKPDVFGFLDHDCFPIKPHDLVQQLAGRDVYGTRFKSRKLADVWNMWAGFCFYRFSRIESCDVDFKPRVELGLDTGGGNWPAIYRSIDPERVLAAEYHPVDTTVELYQDLHLIIDDAFLHVGGASFRKGSQQQTSDRIWNALLNGTDKRALEVTA